MVRREKRINSRSCERRNRHEGGFHNILDREHVEEDNHVQPPSYRINQQSPGAKIK